MALIVVVDDDPDTRDLLGIVVRRLGHDVVSAVDGQDAIEIIRRRPPQLVITDYQMPQMTGADLARAVAADAAISHIPIVMASGSMEMHLVPNVPGITAHLRKPYSPAELARLISALLRDAVSQSELDSEGLPKV